MTKRCNGESSHAGAKAAKAPPVRSGGTRRMDRLVELVDHCAAAKDTADRLGETFLAYLLAMAIQEARAAMRQQPGGGPTPIEARRP